MTPPPAIDHEYVAPFCAGTLAVRAVAPTVAEVLESVIVAFAGIGVHVLPESAYPVLHVYEQAPVAGAQLPLPFAIEQLTLGVPAHPPVPSQTSPLVQALPSLHAVPAAAKSQNQPGLSGLQVGA